MAGGRIYSVGYEGLTVPGLVERLEQNRIEELVDVRASPYSRKPGFSKKRLAESLTAAGIVYRHEPLLGNAFRDVDDFEAAMGLMREHLATGEPAEAVARLVALAEADASRSCAWRATSAVATVRSSWRRLSTGPRPSTSCRCADRASV